MVAGWSFARFPESPTKPPIDLTSLKRAIALMQNTIYRHRVSHPIMSPKQVIKRKKRIATVMRAGVAKKVELVMRTVDVPNARFRTKK